MTTRNEPLHLLEFGLAWPPDSYLRLKLARLVKRGLRVTVVSYRRSASTFSLPGVTVVPMPARGLPLWRVVSGLLREFVLVTAASPRQVLALFISPRRRVLEPPSRGRGSSKGLRDRLEWLWLVARLAPLDPHVVHIEWESVAAAYERLLDLWRSPMVMSCHGGLDLYAQGCSSPWVAGVPTAFGRAAVVHCVSEAMRDEATRHGLDPSKAKVILAGIDSTLFAPAAERPADHASFCVVSVGALRWVKGYEYALMAISQLAREGIQVTVHILGGDPSPDLAEPSERTRILHTAHDLGLEGRIQLHGHVSPREVCSHLQRADALLHMSVSEGLPTVVVEAMASGVPPVATDVGGTREAIRDGVDGFLVPVRDPASAARALRALWRDPDLRGRMGRAGRARVEATFTIERQTDEWLELYARVAQCR
jgi:glycosyltransferase involved in cell wall biosynthesis